MAKCLNCEKEYEAKRETSKFCSTKCRVRHHQKMEKKEKVVLQNEMRLILSKMNNVVAELQNKAEAPILRQEIDPTPMFQQKTLQPRKSAQQWVAEKRDLEDVDQYNKWFAELEADPYLSSKEKSTIKQA